MDESFHRIRVPGPSRGEMIEFSAESWNEYSQCLMSRFKTALFVNILTSTTIAASCSFKGNNNAYKRVGLWGGLFLVGQLVTHWYCQNRCSKEHEKFMQSSVRFSADRVKVTSEPTRQSDEPQLSDYTPPALSDADMSPPSSFSLDPGFKMFGTEEEKSGPKVAETKPVTYEELRARSRDQFGQRPYNNTSDVQVNVPEGKYGDDSSWPRKTNIYGDTLE